MQKLDFNCAWTVQKEGESIIRQTALPDDAMLRETRSPTAKSGSGGAFFAGGKYIYRKDWEVSEALEKKTLILEFEGVYQNAEVFLNGKRIGGRPYGYSNFYIDVTGMVLPGKNNLTVIADNSRIPNTRWYSGSGIYREVRLHVGALEHFNPDGLAVHIAGANKVRVCVSGDFDAACSVKLTIEDRRGTMVSAAEGTDAIMEIPDAQNWEAEHPYLYTCRAQLLKEDEVVDETTVRFGLRTLRWGKDGLSVNGKTTLLRGACIHHDNGVLGACDFADAEYRRVRILKEAGFNAIRSAHNPVSKAMLDACDELGMYVMDEAFDMWLIHKNPYDYAGDVFRAWWQRDIAAMIAKDLNHPSVLLYSIGNEISELGREDGQATAKELVALCHKLDPSRPVTAGINLALAQMAAMSKKSAPSSTEEGKTKDDTAGAPTSEFFNKLMNYLGGRMDKAASTGGANKIVKTVADIFDIPGYNYATSRYALDGRERPWQPTVGSETFTHGLYKNWQYVKSIPTLIGDFMWTGWDYLGESAIGTVRYMDRKTKKEVDSGLIISSGAGVIDICGKQRPETGWNKLIWGLECKPVIGVSPYTHATHFKSKRMWRRADTIASWSWEGCEGARADVTVYSAAPLVELLCNGKSLGKQKTKEYTAVFPRIPYQAGTLEAVSLSADGKEQARSRLRSATGMTKIQLIPETTALRANGQNLCFLNIDLVGENGVTKSSVDQALTVKVSGPAQLQGFGSARPNMAEGFIGSTHTTYYGKALAVIRAGYEQGEAVVTVSGQGLETQTIKLSIQSEGGENL